MAKNPPANAAVVTDSGSIPGLGRSPGGGHEYSSILAWRLIMYGRAWWDTVHKSQRVGHD